MLSIGWVMVSQAQIKSTLSSFNKIIIGPKVDLVLYQGDQEAIRIDFDHIEEDRINYKVRGKTLKIYLDDAVYVEKSIKRGRDWSWSRKKYAGVEVVAHVTYAELKALDVRGEQEVEVIDPIDAPKFKLKLYGEPQVNLNEVICGQFKAKAYGDVRLNVKNGNSVEQIFRLYGDCEVYCSNFKSNNIRATCFGDCKLNIHPESLEITAFGDASVRYIGSPDINKRIVIGDLSFEKIQK